MGVRKKEMVGDFLRQLSENCYETHIAFGTSVIEHKTFG